MSLILSGTDGLSDVDGSAATPAIRGTDANTGIFFPAADTIAFSEGGAEIARFDSSGNLGIGTASPAEKCHIYASSGNSFYKFQNAATGSGASDGGFVGIGSSGDVFLYNYEASNTVFATNNTERMRIDSSGNVGIGTTSPTTKLTVGSIAAGTIDATYKGNIRIEGTETTLESQGGLEFKTTADGYGAKIQTVSSGGTNLAFATRNNSATWTERMRIDPSGNLLVGTTSQVRSSSNPSVQIASAGGEQLVIRHTSATAGRLWRFASDSNNTVYIINQDTTGVYIGNGGSSWLSLSDERHKDIIEPITNAAEKVSTLRAVIGKYKKDEDGTRRSFLIAQDVQAVLPEAVFSADPEQLGLSYTDTIPLLVAAIQEQQAIIEQLKADVAELKAAK